jgi:hypothetical protein
MKTLIPDTGFDPSWTNLGRGAFNARQVQADQLGRQFSNKLRMTNSVPIGTSTDPTVALVGTNEHRALLIIQNNSTADLTTGDFAPIFYIGFGTSPVIGFELGLPPGVGIVLDVRVPSDAIYVGLGPFNNSSGTVVIQGVVKEGGITDSAGDTANIADTGALSQLVALFQQFLAKQP